ncbi:MAG: DedA family protein [Chloroflexi bacterium]|nr:MAG: DedA family protein [Chloroflexota bacterium]
MPLLVRDAARWLFAIVATHQYVVLFAVVAIEEAGLPLPAPSDVVIAFYGFRARDEPLTLALVVLVCALASTLGTLLPFGLARRYGETVARRFARWVDVDPRQVEVWTARIARNGFRAVFVGRLIPGARVAMSIVAGTANVRPAVFSSAVFCAALIYWSVWTGIGVVFGPAVRRVIGPAYVQWVLLALPLVVISYLLYRHFAAQRRRMGAT